MTQIGVVANGLVTNGLDPGVLRGDHVRVVSFVPGTGRGGRRVEGTGDLNREEATTMAEGSTTGSEQSRSDVLGVPTDLSDGGVVEISRELRRLLADVFALYLKTKNFHWHMTGRHFRDYHLLLDEHADQIFAMSDDIAERTRKIGGTTLRSIGGVSREQRLKDNDEEFVAPLDMMQELRDDNRQLTSSLRTTHEVCDKYNDVATASLIENWIDETERRTWFLTEVVTAA